MFDEFMAALQDPEWDGAGLLARLEIGGASLVSHIEGKIELSSSCLRACLMTFHVDVQRAIIDQVPSIVIPMIDSNDGDQVYRVLKVFHDMQNYRGDWLDWNLSNHCLDWKEGVIASLLHNRVTSCYSFDLIMPDYTNLDRSFNPIKSATDYTLFYGAFEKIIKHMLENQVIKLGEIKDKERGRLLLTAVIQRYPALLDLFIQQGASFNTGFVRELRERAIPMDHEYNQMMFSRSENNLKKAVDIISMFPDSKGIELIRALEWMPFTASMAMKLITELEPLTACFVEMTYKGFNEDLGGALGRLLNHPDCDSNSASHLFSVAHSLGMLERVKQAVLLDEVRSLDDQFLNSMLNGEHDNNSLSSYAYGLSRQEVPGDGDCLYHAIALHLNTTVRELRDRAADCIEEGHFNDALPGENAQYTYAAEVRNGAWGDQVEISALMRVLGRPIVVLYENGNPPVMPHQIDDFPGEPIFISFNGVNHYTGLVPNEGINARDVLSTKVTLVERIEALPSDLKIHVFSFLSPSRRISFMPNQRPYLEFQKREARINRLSFFSSSRPISVVGSGISSYSEKRKRLDSELALDVYHAQSDLDPFDVISSLEETQDVLDVDEAQYVLDALEETQDVLDAADSRCSSGFDASR